MNDSLNTEFSLERKLKVLDVLMKISYNLKEKYKINCIKRSVSTLWFIPYNCLFVEMFISERSLEVKISEFLNRLSF